MSSTGLDVFDKTVQKTNEILKDIEEQLNWQGHRNQSYHVLRVILHALRDRLTVAIAVKFADQLPILLRGVFYESWRPESTPLKLHRTEFVHNIREKIIFSFKPSIEELIKIVLESICKHMPASEISKLKGNLPEDLQALISQPQ